MKKTNSHLETPNKGEISSPSLEQKKEKAANRRHTIAVTQKGSSGGKPTLKRGETIIDKKDLI